MRYGTRKFPNPMASTTPMNPVSGCSEQETKAIQAIALGMNRNQAASHAGYSNPQSLTRALQRPRCRTYLNTLFEQAQEKFKITREDVLVGLKDAIDDARLLGDPSAQISGWREIGKILGYYAPEQKQIILTSDQQRLRQQLEDMSDEDLLQLTDVGSLDVLEGEYEELDDD